MSQIKLAIVEDDSMVRENVAIYMGAQPEIEVVQCCSSVECFIDTLSPQTAVPNMLLLDIGLPGMSGIEGIAKIKEKHPDIDIVMLTSFEDSDRIFKALCAGADSYLSKKTDLPTIKQTLLTVNRGGSYMSPSIARKVIEQLRPTKKVEKTKILTNRQQDIVNGLVDGLSYKMIADKLNISVETVRDHIKKIYKKLQVNSKAEVIKIVLGGRL